MRSVVITREEQSIIILLLQKRVDFLIFSLMAGGII
jgi:hypothetical protein